MIIMKQKKSKLSTIDKCDIYVTEITKKLILAIMLAIPIIQVIRLCSMFSNSTWVYDNLNVSCIVYVSLPIMLFIYLYKIIRKEYKIGIKDYILYALTILAIISTIGAVDVKISLYGLSDRFEGVFNIIFYYLLILVASSVDDRKFNRTCINTFIGIGIFQVIYAIYQVIVRPVWVLGFVLPWMANAFCGNPNFFGAFMAMELMTTITLYLFSENNKTFYFAVSIFFAFGVVLSNSFGPLTGILVASIVLLIIVWKNHKKILKNCILVLAVSALTIFVGAYTVDEHCKNKFADETIPGYTLRSDFDEILGAIFKKSEDSKDVEDNIQSENGEETNQISMVTGRSMVWSRAIELAKEHFWFGAGLDNFATIYQPKYGVYIDKAHNIYLNILVTNGIFALVGYVALIIYILVKAFKNLNETSMVFLSVFICYIVQAFFSINVLVVVPYFYIIAGLLLGVSDVRVNSKKG